MVEPASGTGTPLSPAKAMEGAKIAVAKTNADFIIWVSNLLEVF
jgi:hypothetical protein